MTFPDILYLEICDPFPTLAPFSENASSKTSEIYKVFNIERTAMTALHDLPELADANAGWMKIVMRTRSCQVAATCVERQRQKHVYTLVFNSLRYTALKLGSFRGCDPIFAFHFLLLQA